MSKTNDNINMSQTQSLLNGQPQQQIRPTKYAYIVLGLLLAIYICNQWHRSALSYANGYVTDPPNSYYMIKVAIPGWDENYKYLSGAAFTIPISIVGIFMGAASDRVNRKFMLTVACLLWSIMTGLQALADAIWVIYLCRFMVGVFQAACNPPAYSIMADYFHPKVRTRATSIYSLGIYLGGALSSLTGLIISGTGWRWSFAIMGIVGVAAGLFGFVLIREPPRNNFDVKKPIEVDEKPIVAEQKPSPLVQFGRASKEIFINPTCRWVVIAGSFRFFGGYAIGYYMPAYFGAIYTDNKNLYFTLNAFVVSVGGFASAMTGGILSDKLEPKYPRIKAIVCIVGSLLGCPTMALCTLIQNNFAVSIIGLFFEYLFAECWSSPAITMLINAISPANKGFAVSAYLFFTTLSGTLSTFLLGQFAETFELKLHPERYGYILCSFVFFSYLGSVPFFYLAGNSYKSLLEKKKADEEAAAARN